jgi:hypothetical protein
MRSVKEKIKSDGSNQVLMCLAVKKLPGEPAYIVRQGKFFRYGSSRSAYLLCHPRSILCSCSVFLRILRLIVAAAYHIVHRAADILNALMAIPNLIAVLLLSGVIAKETRHYLNNLDEVDKTEIPCVDK